MSGAIERPDREKQYGHVLAEYRFQIQLNWDRTKHYFTFNTVLFGAAVALYNKDAKSWASTAGFAALLLVAALNSFHGAFAVKRGHEYYRSVRKTKSLLEEELKLGEFAIQSTPGMHRDVDRAAEGTPASGSERWASITNQARWLLWLIGILSALGALYAAYQACSLF